MKSNSNKTKTIKKNLQKFIAMMLLFAVINQLAACSYYQVESLGWKNKQQTKTIMLNYQINNKYIIVDCGKESYHVTDMVIDTDSMTIKCCISPVEYYHHLYIPDKKSNQRYKESDGEDIVLNEIHIVTNQFVSNRDSSAVIPINSIIKIAIISPDTGRTAASYVAWILGGILIIPVIAIIVIIANGGIHLGGSSN